MAECSALKFGRHAGGHLVRIEGHGVAKESPALHRYVDLCLEDEHESLVVDLNCCDYLDSTMLGCLAGLHSKYGRVPPTRFMVAANQKTTKRLLEATHIDRLLHVIEAAPTAHGEMVTLTLDQLEKEDLGLHIMQCHRHLADLGGPGADAFAKIADRLERELKQG